MPERRKREAKPCRDRRLNPIIADDRRFYRRPPNGCDSQTYRTDHLAQDRALRPSLAGENLSKVRNAGDTLGTDEARLNYQKFQRGFSG